MASHGTVLTTLAKALLAHLAANGHDPEEIARAAGIDTTGWTDDDARIPREQVDSLFDIAVERTGDGALGVKFAMVLPPGNAGVLEIVAQSARSLEEGLAHVCRYWHLLNDGVDLALVRSEREAVLRLTVRSPKPLARAWIDLTVFALSVVGVRLMARPRPPLRIAVPYPRDRWSAELEAVLPAPLEYDAKALEIALSIDMLAEPLTGANASIQRVAIDLAEKLLADQRSELEAVGELEAAVLRAITERLEQGDANLQNISRGLGVRPRTLQRRLSESKTSLRALLDRARKDIALREVSRRSKSVTDVAFLLGFSETSAFDRAFRRWTGMSPVAYRTSQARPKAQSS